MGGLEPPTHQARISAPMTLYFALADASAMGGRVKPGHDENGRAEIVNSNSRYAAGGFLLKI
jgi:hypothetical protein